MYPTCNGGGDHVSSIESTINYFMMVKDGGFQYLSYKKKKKKKKAADNICRWKLNNYLLLVALMICYEGTENIGHRNIVIKIKWNSELIHQMVSEDIPFLTCSMNQANAKSNCKQPKIYMKGQEKYAECFKSSTYPMTSLVG